MIWSRVSRHTVCLFPMVLLLERQGEGWREVKWAEKEREKRNKGDAQASAASLLLSLALFCCLHSSLCLHAFFTHSIECMRWNKIGFGFGFRPETKFRFAFLYALNFVSDKILSRLKKVWFFLGISVREGHDYQHYQCNWILNEWINEWMLNSRNSE
jgi:hypothetical protein